MFMEEEKHYEKEHDKEEHVFVESIAPDGNNDEFQHCIFSTEHCMDEIHSELVNDESVIENQVADGGNEAVDDCIEITKEGSIVDQIFRVTKPSIFIVQLYHYCKKEYSLVNRRYMRIFFVLENGMVMKLGGRFVNMENEEQWRIVLHGLVENIVEKATEYRNGHVSKDKYSSPGSYFYVEFEKFEEDTEDDKEDVQDSFDLGVFNMDF